MSESGFIDGPLKPHGMSQMISVNNNFIKIIV